MRVSNSAETGRRPNLYLRFNSVGVIDLLHFASRAFYFVYAYAPLKVYTAIAHNSRWIPANAHNFPLRLSTASLSFLMTSPGSEAPKTALPATITLAPASAA
jgi:hypothetical protein